MLRTFPSPLNKILGKKISQNIFRVPLTLSSYVSDLSISRNEVQAINEFISNSFVDCNLNSITIEEVDRRTTGIRTEFDINFEIKVDFTSEAEESVLLVLLNRIQVILFRKKKIRIRFPVKSRPSELLSFEDVNYSIDSEIKEEVFFLIQKYISKPKVVLNSIDRFLDAYRILECYSREYGNHIAKYWILE